MKRDIITNFLLGLGMAAGINPTPNISSTPFRRLSAWSKSQIEKNRQITRMTQEWNTSHKESRQVRRRKQRMESFAEMTKNYPGEIRRMRRSMAFDRLRRPA